MCQRDDEAIVRKLRATNMSQLERIKTLQATIESFDLRLYAANRVLKTRDQENRRLTGELAQQREEHLETLIELQDVKVSGLIKELRKQATTY